LELSKRGALSETEFVVAEEESMNEASESQFPEEGECEEEMGWNHQMPFSELRLLKQTPELHSN
jgi:hypothetical protein